MVNVSQRRCEHDNCRRQPLWGWAGEQRARLCGSHKAPGMENVHVKRCEALGCRKQPNFGNPADRVRRFCKEHKTQSCVNVSTKPCEYPGCGAGARCGYDDQPAVFCRAHRTDGMRVVQRKVCREPGCDKLPSYGREDDRKRLYCAQHRLPGMSSLQRKCQADGCQTEPQFNYAGMRPPKFCQVSTCILKPSDSRVLHPQPCLASSPNCPKHTMRSKDCNDDFVVICRFLHALVSDECDPPPSRDSFPPFQRIPHERIFCFPHPPCPPPPI